MRCLPVCWYRLDQTDGDLLSFFHFLRDSGKFLMLVSCNSEGLSRQKGMDIDLAYEAVMFESRTVLENPNIATDGTYRPSFKPGPSQCG